MEVDDMRNVLVRYRVKPDRVAENEALAGAVYDELARTEPDGLLRYATFKLPDGVSFVHFSSSDVEDGAASPLTELPAFRRFLAGIAERCDEQPVTTSLSELGSFGG
jgi:hypothetical protein